MTALKALLGLAFALALVFHALETYASLALARGFLGLVLVGGVGVGVWIWMEGRK